MLGEFGMDEWRLLELVEEPENVDVVVDVGPIPEMLGNLGTRKRWVLELMFVSQVFVAADVRAQYLAIMNMTIVEKGYEMEYEHDMIRRGRLNRRYALFLADRSACLAVKSYSRAASSTSAQPPSRHSATKA